MKKLPKPETYEQEYQYMPWGRLLNEVLQIIIKKAPHRGRLVDLMCGPGFVLQKLYDQRKDLELVGVDIDARYIDYRRKKYNKIRFIKDDALNIEFKERFDVIVCTAGLHHLPYNRHQAFIKKLSKLLKPNGFCLLADPYIAPYHNEFERKMAATELGVEYLKAILKKNAPEAIIRAGIDILSNDVLADGEYKTNVARIHSFAKRYFQKILIKKTWPQKKSAYGDYYFVLRNPK